MILENKKVAIIGGGPGGLTLARLLQMQNVNVKVYERDLNKDVRVQGSLLDLHDDSGLAALRKADLLEEFKDNYLFGADKMIITNEKAEIVYSDDEKENDADFGEEHFRPEIDRGALRNILMNSLKPETIVWNSHFISMEKQNDGWLMHFKNSQDAYADIVIAADGANSKIRPYITDIKPFYSGVTMLEGNVYDAKTKTPTIYKLLNGGKIMAFGNTKNLLMGLKGNGEIGFYASFKSDENWFKTNGLDYSDRVQMLDWFKSKYSEWSSLWHELFENTSIPFTPRPIYCMPFNETWKTLPNLTMLGDAAHVMPPFAGEGANVAMLDALELSECLLSDSYDNLEEALSFYENSMQKRASIAAKESLENGEKMHSKNALNDMVTFFNQ